MKTRNKELASWCLYDFANSSYSAVIAAVVFPVYYAGRIVGNEAGLGDLWWGRAISVSMLIVALSSPFMGGIADRGGARKLFLFIYTLACVTAVAMFSFLEPGFVVRGFLLIVAANVAMEGGFVFYNSFLPRIAPREYQGRLSGWGFAVGYAGSVLALLAALPLVKAGNFTAVWLMVSAFFFFFSLPAFIFLPGDRFLWRGTSPLDAAKGGVKSALRAFRALWGAGGNKKAMPQSRRFLLSYLFYEDGVNTVIVFSSLFASVTFGFDAGELIVLYLVVQMTALLGAALMARPIDLWGPKRVIMTSLALWVSVAGGAFFAAEKWHFWPIAAVAGMGLGSIQAASRALFARFIPAGEESEYFGIFSMIGKTSAIAGPLVFGWISVATGSQRPAVLAVGGFFLVGLLLIYPLREP